MVGMPRLIHFVASWANPICAPHRAEVERAAQELSADVLEVDLDDAPELCAKYQPLNVPAVAVEGHPDSLKVGAIPAAELVIGLSPFINCGSGPEPRQHP